jgi:hypothetical protein
VTEAINTTGAGLCLHGITLTAGAPPSGMTGIDGGTVEHVAVGSVVALVTRVREGKIRPKRSNLAAHNQVLAIQHAVLPVAFGTVVNTEDNLRRVLRQNHDILVARLLRLEGKVEITLRVYWDTPNIFEFFVANESELREMRDRLFQPGRAPSVSEKIELGTLFESLLQQSRRRHAARVVEAMTPYCDDLRATDAGDEKLIVRLACLVDRLRQELWEKGVEETASQFDNHYCFKYGPPAAPYSFTDVDLKLDEES